MLYVVLLDVQLLNFTSLSVILRNVILFCAILLNVILLLVQLLNFTFLIVILQKCPADCYSACSGILLRVYFYIFLLLSCRGTMQFFV